MAASLGLRAKPSVHSATPRRTCQELEKLHTRDGHVRGILRAHAHEPGKAIFIEKVATGAQKKGKSFLRDLDVEY
jgi:hypothetical protein